MSQISNTPRRPSTAQSAPLTTRMPYEAGEALLWERQNHHVHAHLSLQMKGLQAQHDAYDARIQATESIAEAAEAAVHKLKQMEAKIAAMEADDQDRPFDAWAKEAISQFQMFVDGHKGVRQKLSGLEQKVEGLGEDAEGVKDVGGLLRNVVRRLDVLEEDRREEGRKVKELEKEVDMLRTSGRRQEVVHEDVHEETYDEVQADDNPLAVFYGIDTQSPSKRHDHGRKINDRYQGDGHTRRLTDSPQQRRELPGDLQPPGEDTVRPEEDGFDLLEEGPEIEYGWENTQQFKDMQKELATLRAMCQTQEPKSSNQTADATQRPHETLILPRENEIGFSDATTETEAEYNDTGRNRPRTEAARGSVGALSSDLQLPSSPPKRTDTQSARRNLMKRPSIYDPRVPSVNEHRQIERPGPDAGAGTGLNALPSPLVKLPVETQLVDDRVSAKRKRVEDAPTQRVTRLKITDDRTAARKSVVPAARKNRPKEEIAFVDPVPLPISDDAPAPPSPTRKTCGKQKPAANRPVQRTEPQASSNRPEHPAVPVTKPAVSVAEAVKSRKGISKPKPVAKDPIQQQAPAQATPSSSKQAAAAVKREAKGPRQPAGACKSCRSRHQKCDRTHPTCGRCAKSGASCEYAQASTSNAPSVAPTTSPRKKQALLPISAIAKEANREHELRGRSVTVSPEAPRQKSSAKHPTPASPSKRSTAAATLTAASSRAPRAKNIQKPRASPKKHK